MNQFWKTQKDLIDDIDPEHADWKLHALPLARIKKVMKLDDSDIKFISADGPLVFAKACEIFILELTLRAWNFTARNKRRTLQRNDVALAIADFDMFDFLIDIVPRPEVTLRGSGRGASSDGSSGSVKGSSSSAAGVASPESHMQEYMKLLSQQQQIFFSGGAGVSEVDEIDADDGDEHRDADDLGLSSASGVESLGSAVGHDGDVNVQEYYQQMMQMFAHSPAR